MKYLIVHRGREIYKLRFERGEDGRLYLKSDLGMFYIIYNWESERVMHWLVERDFEHYWERNGDG